MLKHVEEYGKYVEITGFRNVKVKNAEEFVKASCKDEQQGVWVQFFDAGLVASWQHLYFAVLNALLAFRNKRSVSKSVGMEVMLYASAERQIRKAIELLGVKCDSENVAVVIIGENPAAIQAALTAVSRNIRAEPDETVLELSEEKVRCIRRAFGVTEKELETVIENNDAEQALVNLVIEKVALLSTQI